MSMLGGGGLSMGSPVRGFRLSSKIRMLLSAAPLPLPKLPCAGILKRDALRWARQEGTKCFPAEVREHRRYFSGTESFLGKIRSEKRAWLFC